MLTPTVATDARKLSDIGIASCGRFAIGLVVPWFLPLGLLSSVEQNARQQKGPRTTESDAEGRASSDQSVLPALRDVRKLGLRAPGRVHQEAIHRRDEARRSSDRAHPVSGRHPEHDGADDS